MKIIDSILFNGEIDMLLLRLKEYNQYIDNFIIIEGDKTFTKLNKNELYTDIVKNDIRFNEYLQKIEFFIYNIIDTDPWVNEKKSRNAIQFTNTFKNLADDDIIIHGDCDEILRRETLNKIKNGYNINLGKTFLFKNVFFCLKWHYPNNCYTSIVVTKKTILENDIHCLRLSFRENKLNHYNDEIGWHFSFFGNIDDIINKINNFSHQEMNRPEYNNADYILKEIINNGNAVDFFTVNWNKGHVPKLLKNNLLDLPDNVKIIDKFNLV